MRALITRESMRSRDAQCNTGLICSDKHQTTFFIGFIRAFLNFSYLPGLKNRIHEYPIQIVV